MWDGSFELKFNPQSRRIVLSLVWTRTADLPTSFTPPKGVNITKSDPPRVGLKIRSPTLRSIRPLSSPSECSTCLVVAMILEGKRGALTTLGLHFVFLRISCNMIPSLPIAKPGFLASKATSPRFLSKSRFETPASWGIKSLIAFSAFTSFILIEGSERITTLLWRALTISVTI